jgi:7-cyano-7-deazaguanine synthase
MCGICGVIFSNKGQSRANEKTFLRILERSEARGRDSFGVAVIEEHHSEMYHYTSKPSETPIIKGLRFPKGVRMVIANTRAEPTTEYVEKKTTSDVQPFSTEHGNVIVAHNGTIANDKDIEKENPGMEKRKTKIDTAVIPPYLQHKWNGQDPHHLAKILSTDVVGSLAMAIWDERSPNTLWLATNYKPIYLCSDRRAEAVYFASLPEFLPGNRYHGYPESYGHSLFGDYTTVEVKPYSLIQIEAKGGSFGGLTIHHHSLWKQDMENKDRKERALVIASGGMDSTVCASWSISEGYETELLHFNYGCLADSQEIQATKKIAEFLHVPLTSIDVDFFKKTIRHSRLTNPKETGELVKKGDGEASAELAWEYVPARNLIFMSIAAAFAEANKFDYIILGGNLEESGAYPDNEIVFQRKFDDILPNALDLQHRVRVLTPVGHLMKHEIVKLGIDLRAPLHLAWSCYEDKDIHCGRCGPCLMRRVGFKMNGLRDMIPYEWVPEGFWDKCEDPITSFVLNDIKFRHLCDMCAKDFGSCDGNPTFMLDIASAEDIPERYRDLVVVCKERKEK